MFSSSLEPADVAADVSRSRAPSDFLISPSDSPASRSFSMTCTSSSASSAISPGTSMKIVRTAPPRSESTRISFSLVSRTSSSFSRTACSMRGPSATPSSCVRTPSDWAARRRMISIAEPPAGYLLRELESFDALERPDLHQLVHVDAVRLVGRNASGRRVRMEEKSLLFQVAHRVADGRRRDPESEPARDRARSRGLRRLDVRADHRLEDLAFAIGELGL